MGEMYHITILVSGEQEDAIRSLFRDKNWTCCIQALSNDHIECLKRGGYSDIFLTETSESLDTCNNLYKEIKTEISAENDNEFGDNQSLDDSEISPNPVNHDNESQGSVKLENTSSSAEDGEGYSQSFDEPMNLSSTSVDANNDTIMDSNVAHNQLPDGVIVDKIQVPNPAYLMIYPHGNSQLVGNNGQPVENIIPSMGSMYPTPVGNIISSMESMYGNPKPVGNVIPQLSDMTPQSGYTNQRSRARRGRKPVGNLMQQLSGMTQQSGYMNRRVRRGRPPVRYNAKTDDSETESDNGPECSVCGARFIKKYELKKHYREIHASSNRVWRCKECTATYKTYYELRNHRRKEHPQTEAKVVQQSEEIKKLSREEMIAVGYLECHLCGSLCRNDRTLKQHKRNQHIENASWTCDVCNDVYTNYKEYCKHIKATGHQTSISMLGSYMCEICGKIIKRFDNFKEHKKICTNDDRTPEEKKTLPCDVCGSKFKTEMQVYDHKRFAHTFDPSTCEICGAVMKNKTALYSHRKRHDPESRKFPCDECDKGFLTNWLLKQHKRTHTKEKPFKCPACDYSCAARGNLNKHARGVHKMTISALSELAKRPQMPVDSLPAMAMDSYMS